MTRAPRFESTRVQYGPASTRVRSMTTVPASGRGSEALMGRAYDRHAPGGHGGRRMARGGREPWGNGPGKGAGPGAGGPFLVGHGPLVGPGLVVDVAAGTGRNAAFLAARGHRVIALDVARPALERLHAMD